MQMLKINLIFYVLFMEIHLSLQKYCNGITCDDNCQNCKYSCDPNTCKASNNCQCASRKIPGNLSLSDTPQFFIFTIDDAPYKTLMDKIQNLDFLLKNNKIKDANGCAPRVSLYFLSDGAEYEYAKFFELNGGSISLHTITHKTYKNSGKERWEAELENNYKSIIELGYVNDIPGARAPYLSFDNDYLQIIKTMGLKYDSSMFQSNYLTSQNPDDHLFYWPFTLDNGIPDINMRSAEADPPNQGYPGLWEFPIPKYQNSKNEEYVSIDPVITNTSLNDFKSGFDLSYNSNRVPRGIYVHYNGFTVNHSYLDFDQNIADFYKNYLEWIVQHPNLLFATENMVIEWMKNPQPFSVTKNLPLFQCPQYIAKASDACNVRSCALDVLVDVCGDCPLQKPNIETKWSKYEGNTNAFDRNEDFKKDDNKTSFWTASETKATIAGSWGSGAQIGLSFKNGNTINANAAIITLYLRHGTISSLWGWGFKLVEFGKNNYFNKFRIIGPTIQIKSGQVNDQIGIILQTDSSFSFSKDFLIGVELYEQPLNCQETTCPVVCGDGKCSSEESKITCPVDCFFNGDNGEQDNQENVTNTAVTGKINLIVSSQWNTGLCAQLKITNSALESASASVLSFKLCGSPASVVSFWGSEQSNISMDPIIYRQVNKVNYGKGVESDSGGFCANSYQIPVKVENLRVSVEFYQKIIGCSSSSCKPRCGNGVCEDGESEENCAFDCKAC